LGEKKDKEKNELTPRGGQQNNSQNVGWGEKEKIGRKERGLSSTLGPGRGKIKNCLEQK